MKKKIGLFFCFLLGICAVNGAVLVSHSVHNDENAIAMYAEGETFEEKSYTYSDSEGTATLTLISETEFKIEIEREGQEPEVKNGTYTKEGNVLTLKYGENELKVSVDDVNMTFGEYVETYECSVVLGEYVHGEITLDKDRGHVGETVTMTVKPTLLYLVEYVKVNGVNLVEDETTKWVYSFVLVEGENKVEAKFAVDKELLGEMSVIYEQAINKDWTHLFSLENVLRIVAFLLEGGILLVIARYFIQDKKIGDGVERGVSKTVSKVIPEAAKEAVLANTKEVLKPMFSEITGYQQDIIRVVGILIKCIALMQEGTPDARRAILAELANLNIGDMQVIEKAKKFIDDYFAQKAANMEGMMNDLNKIIEQNKNTANTEENNSEQENENDSPVDNGAQYE